MGYNDYLTIEQAEQRLTTIRPLLETARLLKREIEMIAAHYNYDTMLLEEEKPHITQIITKLSETIDELEDQGCYVKDLDLGIIDFLSTFEGRDVFLCWKLSDQGIKHWHEIDEGFSQRQDILDLSDPTLLPDFETPYVENEN